MSLNTFPDDLVRKFRVSFEKVFLLRFILKLEKCSYDKDQVSTFLFHSNVLLLPKSTFLPTVIKASEALFQSCDYRVRIKTTRTTPDPFIIFDLVSAIWDLL